MQWQQLIVFIVPLVTAWIAFRSTGSRRWIAIVATLASTGLYAPTLFPELTRLIHPAVSSAVLAVGLVAILILAAGRLRHFSQWLAVGVGALAVAIFFFALTLGVMGDVQFIPPEIAAALLTAGVAVMLGVPPIIGAYLKAREERAKARAERWHPGQWAAVAVGVLAIAAAVVLFAIPRFRWLVDRDVFLIVCFAGLLTMVLGPRLIGYILKTHVARVS